MVLRLRSPDTEFIYKIFIKEMVPEEKKKNRKREEGQGRAGRQERDFSKCRNPGRSPQRGLRPGCHWASSLWFKAAFWTHRYLYLPFQAP